MIKIKDDFSTHLKAFKLLQECLISKGISTAELANPIRLLTALGEETIYEFCNIATGLEKEEFNEDSLDEDGVVGVFLRFLQGVTAYMERFQLLGEKLSPVTKPKKNNKKKTK